MGWWGVFSVQLPRCARKRASPPTKLSNALDACDIPLAATKHQPVAVQEVRGPRHPLLAVDPDVVDVGAALPDSPPRCALAVRQHAGTQQVNDGFGSAWLELDHRCLPKHRSQRRLVELR